MRSDKRSVKSKIHRALLMMTSLFFQDIFNGWQYQKGYRKCRNGAGYILPSPPLFSLQEEFRDKREKPGFHVFFHTQSKNHRAHKENQSPTAGFREYAGTGIPALLVDKVYRC